MRWRLDDGVTSIAGCAFHRSHRAMMRTVTAAAGGQGNIFARVESEGERSCREEQDQQDGKGAPHPWTMLQELW